MTTLHGIDVSHYQSGLKLSATDAQFVIAKATESTNYVDNTCDSWISQAKSLGIPWGTYHFYQGNPTAEADFYIKNVSGYVGAGILVLDFETHTSDVAGAKAFLDRVTSKTGVRPLLYTSQSVANGHDWSSVAKDYALWVARYNTEIGPTGAWKNVTMWQHTDAYPTGGKKVDGDYFYGDRTAWNTLASGTGGGGGGSGEKVASRTGQAAIDYALDRVGGTMPDAGLCLQFTRQNYDVPSVYGSAIEAWDNAERRYPGDRNPPPGVPVYFQTPSPYRHVAFWVGDGTIVTTNGDKIQRWSSLSQMEADFQGPYMGWTEDLNTYLVRKTDAEDEDMDYHGFTTKKALALPAGQWKTLRLNDDGDLSMLSATGPFQALVQVSVDGMTPGHQLGLRFKLVDTKSGKDTVRYSTYPATEIIGTGGLTEGQGVQYGKISTPESGWTRRLRAEVMTYDEDVTVVSTQTRAYQ